MSASESSEPRYSFTQPLCEHCWNIEHPDRQPTRMRDVELEHCCKCAEPTASGIYIRVDPKSVRWPTRLKAE